MEEDEEEEVDKYIQSHAPEGNLGLISHVFSIFLFLQSVINCLIAHWGKMLYIESF